MIPLNLAYQWFDRVRDELRPAYGEVIPEKYRTSYVVEYFRKYSKSYPQFRHMMLEYFNVK